MRTSTAFVTAAIVGVSLCCIVTAAPQSVLTRSANDVVRQLSGLWTAPVNKVALGSDLDVRIWGPHASRVRTVNLTLERSGRGIVTIHTSVVDAHGRTERYSASVIEASVVVEPPSVRSPMNDALAVGVSSAEERYRDDSGERRSLDGIRISLSPVSTDASLLNIRYDTPQGYGSFGETLHRSVTP